MVRFEKALMLAKGAKEALYERRSTRGLAAAARLQVRPVGRPALSWDTCKSCLCFLSPGAEASLDCSTALPIALQCFLAWLLSTRGLCGFVQGQQKTAIQHLERVLEISNGMGDHVGDADAYGTIADIYTDMGQFEKAAKYYDQYIEKMNSDGPV